MLSSLPISPRLAVARGLGRVEERYWIRAPRGGGRGPAPAANALRLAAGGLGAPGAGPASVLGLRALGRGAQLLATGTVRPTVSRNRISYVRPGVVEWYTNGPLGLEQGFDLERRPEGSGVLTLVAGIVPATWRASLSRSSLAMFDHRDRAVADYGELAVTDARGMRVPAHIALSHRRILLRIDDRRARYPLEVDPLFELAELTSSNPARLEELGVSVASSGDTVVASSYGDFKNGALYVFVEGAHGWADATETAKLTASNVNGNAYLGVGNGFGQGPPGVAISADGNTIVAGAQGQGGSRGAVYVFTKPAGGWRNATQTAELTASDRGQSLLGLSVDISADGGTIVAGAPRRTGADGLLDGGAYVFVKPPGGWVDATETALLLPDAAVTNTAACTAVSQPPSACPAESGASVAISGDASTIATGAPGSSANAVTGGAVLVYSEPAGGWASTQTENAVLTESRTAGGAELGWSDAISADGGTIVGGADGIGDAFVFTRPANGWTSGTETAELTDSQGGDDGGDVAITRDGDTVYTSTVAPENSALMFTRPTGGWQSERETGRLTVHDPDGGFGWSVGVAPDGSVAVGDMSRAIGDPPVLFAGAAYVFGPQQHTSTTLTCPAGSASVDIALACTVTVSNTVAGVPPTGTVQFDDGGAAGSFSGACTLAPTGPLSSACQTSYTPAPPATSQTLTAAYGGDATHTASSGTTALTVSLIGTTTSVSCAGGSIPVGQPITCTATVVAGAGVPPTGTVTFSSPLLDLFDANATCTLAPSSGLTAACQTALSPSARDAGRDPVSAGYDGDAAHAASDGSTSVFVEPPLPTVSGQCSATAVNSTTMILRATVNPQGLPATYRFDFGPSASYGAATGEQPLPADTQDHPVTAAIAGLSAGTVLHCRIVVSSKAGVTYGVDGTATTPGGAGIRGNPHLRLISIALKPVGSGCQAEGRRIASLAQLREPRCDRALLILSGAIDARADGGRLQILARALGGRRVRHRATTRIARGRWTTRFTLQSDGTEPGRLWTIAVAYLGNSVLSPARVSRGVRIETEVLNRSPS
jgi:trimeric autotransporter adhesin